MKSITQQQLIDLLIEIKGATAVSLVTHTEPKMKKTDNPYVGRINKITTYNGMLNFDYQNSVNNQREREGAEKNFSAQSTWGTHLSPCVIEHNGNHYVQFKVERIDDSKYLLDGVTPINKSMIQPFLSKRYKSKTQNVKKDVEIRRFKISSIATIKLKGETYAVK